MLAPDRGTSQQTAQGRGFSAAKSFQAANLAAIHAKPLHLGNPCISRDTLGPTVSGHSTVAAVPQRQPHKVAVLTFTPSVLGRGNLWPTMRSHGSVAPIPLGRGTSAPTTPYRGTLAQTVLDQCTLTLATSGCGALWPTLTGHSSSRSTAEYCSTLAVNRSRRWHLAANLARLWYLGAAYARLQYIVANRA